jgi:hypothetical protein
VLSVNKKTLAEKLERDRVVGWIDTAYHDVHRKIRMLANGDSSVLFGLGDLMPTTIEETVGALSELAGWDYANGEPERSKSYVSPELTVANIERAAERLREACQRGERVFFGTGHPTGPLEMYARLADAMRERGAEIVRVSEGDSFDGYIGGGRITYVCDVATVSMSGDLVHTHSAKPMEFLLSSGLKVDFVMGDHGFTGAALTRGLDAVAVVDTNDPALVLAWGRKLRIWPILCDDNRPAAAYHSMTDFIIERL